jgi:hypothetical protein
MLSTTGDALTKEEEGPFLLDQIRIFSGGLESSLLFIILLWYFNFFCFVLFLFLFFWCSSICKQLKNGSSLTGDNFQEIMNFFSPQIRNSLEIW